MVEAIEDLVGGGYWSYAPKRMAFLKWACLTYFGLKRAVLTHDVVQTTDTLEDDQPAVQDICWGQPWMDKVCLTGSMFLLNGNKKCDWHALVVSA